MNRLKHLRKNEGLSQQELAQEMETTKLTISNWENGKHRIKADKADQLAKFFNVSLGYLLGIDTPTNDSIAELIAKVNRWAISHGLDKSNPKTQWMKVTEEVGEIRDVFLKPNDFDDPEFALKDAIGDSIVTLIVLCLQLGYSVEKCLSIAYNEIKDREGIMIDGNFVKKTKSKNNS